MTGVPAMVRPGGVVEAELGWGVAVPTTEGTIGIVETLGENTGAGDRPLEPRPDLTTARKTTQRRSDIGTWL